MVTMAMDDEELQAHIKQEHKLGQANAKPTSYLHSSHKSGKSTSADTECHKLAHASFDAFAPCREMTLACIHSSEFACEIVKV